MTTELDMHQVQTKAFIDAKPSLLTLTPRVRHRQPNGGWQWVPGNPRIPQTFRVLERTEPNVTTVDDGVQRTISYVLLGMPDALVAKGDTFTYQGDTLEVVEMNTANDFEVRAFVSRALDPPVTV
jgi:hypothetical protein